MGDRRAQMRDTGFEVVVATRPRNTRVVEPCARGDHIQCQTECYNWPFGRTLLCGRAQRESHFFAPRSRKASLGTTDIVAVAPGKIVPSGRTKFIQPFETGVVRAIHVQDGQSVRAGEVLIELDPTMSRQNLGT
jgi:Biotin-lipoyl like